jgi:SAM-dependent methyltransferase
MPPFELRQLVGPTDPADFDNPSGDPVYPELPAEQYRSLLDFGCGCGRTARRLIQQRPRPERYVGLDLHKDMIRWCRDNLAPHAPGFEFRHHDVFNAAYNPGRRKPQTRSFGVEPGAFSLVEAHSVFTHLVPDQIAHYLGEVARALEPGGVFRSTWFFLDKRYFPMMRTEHRALYMSYEDPSLAVIYDRVWVLEQLRAAGLTVYSVLPPNLRGFQWVLLAAPSRAGIEEADFPRDDAPFGEQAPQVRAPDQARRG